MSIAGANAILDGLNAHEADALQNGAREVPLERGVVIADLGEPSPYVYFPTRGVLSLVGSTSGGATVEVAVVGNEGVASLSAALGGDWLPYRILTQIPGRAIRVPTGVVSSVLNECGDLHQRMLEYAHQLIAQVAQSAVCNRFHNARQRLARWLLMTADRAGTNELPLTHEFISSMVGGPRSAVTEAAAELRQSGSIDYRRGLITVCSHDRLRAQACECYELADARNRRRTAAIAVS
jgi:CRP-like cAMP-binding protein